MKTFRSLVLPLLISILTKTIYCELNADNVVVAINCGGEAFQDSKGIIYEKVNLKINLFLIISRKNLLI